MTRSALPAETRTGWLTVVGCLPSGALAPGAPVDALEADAVFGPGRLLEAARVAAPRRRPWPRPLADGVRELLARRGAPTTVLASGDPLHHGIAATLLRDVAPGEMAIYPAPSAFSLSAAALRWPLDGVALVSLHTAPPEAILTHVAPGRRILALTRDGTAPAAIAAVLTRAGWGESPVAVCEALGGPDSAVRHATAATLSGEAHPLNVLAVECSGGTDVRHPVRADDLLHDGCITRDEIRLLTIAALSPPGHPSDAGAPAGHLSTIGAPAGQLSTIGAPAGPLSIIGAPAGHLSTIGALAGHLSTIGAPAGQLSTIDAAAGHLWDIGAGSGAVAIDWCRAGGTATLFERVPSRLDAIAANLSATGTVACVLAGDALERLADAAAPDRVFLGGAVSSAPLFEAAWAALPSGGVLVSNAVTLAGEAATLERHARHGGRLTRIALSHDAPVGGLTALKPAMPVLQWRATKP